MHIVPEGESQRLSYDPHTAFYVDSVKSLQKLKSVADMSHCGTSPSQIY